MLIHALTRKFLPCKMRVFLYFIFQVPIQSIHRTHKIYCSYTTFELTVAVVICPMQRCLHSNNKIIVSMRVCVRSSVRVCLSRRTTYSAVSDSGFSCQFFSATISGLFLGINIQSELVQRGLEFSGVRTRLKNNQIRCSIFTQMHRI